MKQDYPDISKERICRLFGKTRHALYDHQWRSQDRSIHDDIVIQMVHKLRQSLPRVGTRKLIPLLRQQLSTYQIKIGRDYLFHLLQRYNLLIRQRKRKAYTTNSNHWMRKYSNLIKDLVISRPEQVWVSDITYIRMINQWGYLSLVTDAYSRKIMGFGFCNNLSVSGCLEALEMALKNRNYPQSSLIHHSDRGTQYCCKEYVDVLARHEISISMTENGDPRENAIAERVNGIIKAEFNLYSSQDNFVHTYHRIIKSITAYNELRPHSSCNNLTPVQAHKLQGLLTRKWKNYFKNYHPKSQKKNIS